MKKKTRKQKVAAPVKKQSISIQAKLSLSNAFLLKGNNMVEKFTEDHLKSTPIEKKFRSVKEMEQVILKNYKSFFGQQSFLISLPKKDESVFPQGNLPSGLLLDLSDFIKPKLYIIDVSLEKQSLIETVLPRVARHISQLMNPEFAEKLSGIIAKDKYIAKELKTKLKPADVPAYLKSAIIGRPSILLISDDEMKDLKQLITTFGKEWQSVKNIILKKYASNGHTFCIMSPLFTEINGNGKKRTPNAPVSEEYHLEKASDEIKAVYKKIKAELLKVNNQLQFNPQKYYISMRRNRNLAFFHFSRKNISLVVMNPEKDTRRLIRHHEVKTLTEKVQKFWNGKCCTVDIGSQKYLSEVINLLKKLVKN